MENSSPPLHPGTGLFEGTSHVHWLVKLCHWGIRQELTPHEISHRNQAESEEPGKGGSFGGKMIIA